MNSEKVKEIKKVLECCFILTNRDLPMETRDDACHDCPYSHIERCTPLLVKNSLTLINELENNYQNVCVLLTAKNEQICDLTKENERLLDQRNKTYNIWVKDTEKLKNRIAELEHKLDAKESYYNAVKDRALEVFAQKIKENLDISVVGYSTEEVVTNVNNTIDETSKERLGK